MFKIIEPINIFQTLRSSQENSKAVEKVMGYLQQINEPVFYAKEVGVNSKLLNDWIKAGIIDILQEEGKDQWRKFSLAEAIWLKFVEELRFFGVGLSVIKEYKKKLFEIDMNRLKEIKDYFLANKDNNADYLIISKGYENIFKNGDAEALKLLQLINPTSFSVTLLMVLTQRADLAFVFNQQMAAFLDITGSIAKEFPKERSGLDELHKHLSSHSFALINFKSLLTRFFDNEKVNPDINYYFGIMSEKEKGLLEKIRSDNYSKVTVSLESGTIILTRVTKKSNEQLMKQLARLLKKGDFKEVEFISRDGVIVKYNETDIIK